jgi:hypothetical protein
MAGEKDESQRWRKMFNGDRKRCALAIERVALTIEKDAPV